MQIKQTFYITKTELFSVLTSAERDYAEEILINSDIFYGSELSALHLTKSILELIRFKNEVICDKLQNLIQELESYPEYIDIEK